MLRAQRILVNALKTNIRYAISKKTNGFSSSAKTASILNLEVREDGVGIVRFDDPNSAVNTLNEALIVEMKDLLTEIENNDKIKSTVIISGKKGNFIAGADINMLAKAKTAEEVKQISLDGHQLFNRLERCKPSVAAIDGSCLGGGLEVAMACTYRIASSGSATVLGLPEVQLGLLPGGGGTQRLPKLVGIQQAMTLATTRE